MQNILGGDGDREDLKVMGKVNPERGAEITNYDSVRQEREGELNQERQKKSRTEPES